MNNSIARIDHIYRYKKSNKHTLLKTIITIVIFLTVYILASTSDYNTLARSQAIILHQDMSDQEVNALYEQDKRGEITLSDYQIRYLQAIDESNNL